MRKININQCCLVVFGKLRLTPYISNNDWFTTRQNPISQLFVGKIKGFWYYNDFEINWKTVNEIRPKRAEKISWENDKDAMIW